MPSDTAEGFARAFSQAWLMQDTAGLAALFAQDADFLTLTGQWCEGRAAIEWVMKAELKGAFARARLVTGRSKLRPLGPEMAIVHQRFVLSGILNADGTDAGRVATMLIAVLQRGAEGWTAVSGQFAVEGA